MQPLSRINPNAILNWGFPTTMIERPTLATKVAQCIAQWAEIEAFLGAFLGLLLHANEAAAVAMYSGIENRAAQLRMINAAARVCVPEYHFNVLSCFFSAVLRPVMRERDKLAHWTWGYSDNLPDALLIAEPSQTLNSLLRVIREAPGVERAAVQQNYDNIYVVRNTDLDRMIKRSIDARTLLRLAMASVWENNSPELRAQFLHQLSTEPQVLAAMTRLGSGHQKTQASPTEAHQSEPSETP